MRPILLSLFLLLILTGSKHLQAQDKLFNGSQHRIGFQYGYADQELGLFSLDVNYHYELHLYRLQYYRTLLSKSSSALEMLIQPQYNRGVYALEVDQEPDRSVWECGVNVGLLARKNFRNDQFSVYALISAGPHYVSGAPERQKPGFIFSDNFMGGVNMRAYREVYVDLRFGVRHISNANLSLPNGGVNNFILNLGFLKNL